MSDAKPSTPIERLHYCIADEGAPKLVAAHFDPDGDFEGELFSTLGENPPYEFSNDDLLALTCLDEYVRPKSLRRIFSEEGRSEIRALLEAMAPDARIEDPDAPLDAAFQMWSTLVNGRDPAGRKMLYPRIGDVNATKLMARKRPALVPIVDRVVRAVVDAPKRYWSTYQEFMRLTTTQENVAKLREAAAAHVRNTDRISDLRLVDIAVWMRGSGSKSAYMVRDALGVPDLSWVPRP